MARTYTIGWDKQTALVCCDHPGDATPSPLDALLDKAEGMEF